jgi:hypothetical protein
MRFFTHHGNQIPGLFETNADVAYGGHWQLVEGDKIEVSVEFKFQQPVTRRGVRNSRQQMDIPSGSDPIGADNDTTERVVIPSNSTFNIRLQIRAVDTLSPPPDFNMNTPVLLLLTETYILENNDYFRNDVQWLSRNAINDTVFIVVETSGIYEYLDTEELSPGGLFHGLELLLPGYTTTFVIQGHATFTVSIPNGIPCMIFSCTYSDLNFRTMSATSQQAFIISGDTIVETKHPDLKNTFQSVGGGPGFPMLQLINETNADYTLPIDLSNALQMTLATNGDEQLVGTTDENNVLQRRELRCNLNVALCNAQLAGVSLTGFTLYGRGVPPGTILTAYNSATAVGVPSGQPLSFLYSSNSIDYTQINGTVFILEARALIEAYASPP